MSTSQRSYYEIALTNRQVLIAFSILLGCVVSAFISGLWVGRQAAARTLVEAEATGGVGAPPASDTYRFFGEEKPSAEEPPEPTSSLPPATPPAQARLTSPESAPERSRPSESEVTQPAPAQPREARTRAGLPPRAETPTPSSTEARAAEPPESGPVPPAAAKAPSEEPSRRRVVDPPATSELSVIQVFSTPDEAQARAVLDRLKGGGFRAFLSPVQVDGRTMYRVRVGPFRERATAEVEAEKLKRLYKLDTWITN